MRERGEMILTQKQREIVEATNHTIVVNSSAAAGKALENGSKVYTEYGPKSIEKLSAGEKIYGRDGQLHTVMGVFPQGKKKKYLVEFSDHTIIECCEEHLWTFQTESLRGGKSKTWITKTLREIIEHYPLYNSSRAKNNFGDNLTFRKNIFIPMCDPIDFPKRELPLDPYTLGALLGDGHLNGRGRSSMFSNEEEDVLNKVNQGLKKIGSTLKHSQNFDYRIVNILPLHYHEPSNFDLILEELKLDYSRSGDKFIPDIYKYSSIEDRIELLKGIIDTDGYISGSAYDIILKSKRLIMDIKEVCESLGFTATFFTKRAICTNSSIGKKDCGEVYRLRIKTSKQIPKIHFSQKRESQWKQPHVFARRAIIGITPTNEEVEMTCIQIDSPDELFVTNNFIVTHNTTILTERVKHLLINGVDSSKIVVITFTNAAAEEMKMRIGDKLADCFVGTIHSYANHLLLRAGISTSKYLEEGKFDRLFELTQKITNYPEVQHLLLDEAQDTDSLQWQFILKGIKPEYLFAVGDIRQELYGFRGADIKTFLGLRNRKDAKVFELNENFRNGYNILRYAEWIMNRDELPPQYHSSVIWKSGRQGKVTKTTLNFDWIAEEIRRYDDYRDWFFLTRDNRQLQTAKQELEKRRIPCSTFTQGDMSKAEIAYELNKNTVKVLTCHASKGLERNNVMVYGARYNSKDELCCTYVATTRAKERLYMLTAPKRDTKKLITNWE